MANPAHRKNSEILTRRSRATNVGIGVSAVAIAALAAGSVAYATGHMGGGKSLSASGHGSGSATSVASTVPLPPLSVVSISPAATATNVASNAPIQIQFSQPIKPDAPRPVLTPDVAGTWTQSGATLTFQPQGGYLPFATERVSVPAATSATVGERVTTLAATYQASFTVAPGSTERVEQMLAELGYMPLQFIATPAAAAATAPATPSSSAAPTAEATTIPGTPTTTGVASTDTSSTASVPTAASTFAAEATAPDAVDVSAETGTMTWRFANTPASLTSLWTAGKANVIDQGAIMAFENDHGMRMDGQAGPKVWAALVSDVAARKATTKPYNYLVANKSAPESLSVWQNGRIIYTSPANTGVAAAPTPNGTWPVYDRYATTTMSGHNPDGSAYHDPGIPWVAYFHGGDAVHGFNRGSYGVPQSVGCVELPPDNAKVVWTLDPYGTLVTVL